MILVYFFAPAQAFVGFYQAVMREGVVRIPVGYVLKMQRGAVVISGLQHKISNEVGLKIHQIDAVLYIVGIYFRCFYVSFGNDILAEIFINEISVFFADF